MPRTTPANFVTTPCNLDFGKILRRQAAKSITTGVIIEDNPRRFREVVQDVQVCFFARGNSCGNLRGEKAEGGNASISASGGVYLSLRLS